MKKQKSFYLPLLIIIGISLGALFNFNYQSGLKQLIWVSFGLLSLKLMTPKRRNFIILNSQYLYFFCLILLGLVLIWGKPINGSRAWFDFKWFAFQPSELMKLILVLYLTRFQLTKTPLTSWQLILIFLIPALLVYWEPDTGAIIMYLVIFIGAWKWFFKRKKFLIGMSLLGLGILTLFFFLYFKKPDFIISITGSSIFYRMDRILKWQSNYQLENALLSLKTSSWWKRNHRPMLYIPESLTDFCFARLVGNYGLGIGLGLLVCYAWLLIVLTKEINPQNQVSFLTFAFVLLFWFQVSHNIAMNLGLVPIMGLPCPFLSYGGSNTIIYFLFLAFIFPNEKKPYLASS